MTDNKLDLLVLLAVQYIEQEKNYNMKPYPKTIASFLMGAKSSPFYDFFKKHPDVCGSVNFYISKDEIENSLLRLEQKGELDKKITRYGKTLYSISRK